MKDIELPPLPDLGSQWTPYWTKVVHKQMQSYARAAVEADRAQRVPEGWKLVPVEPTREMIIGALESPSIDWIGHYDLPQSIYRAMLASTPAQPAQQEQRIPAEFDVRSILLSISPGEDGMGHEVYAASVADVEGLLTSMGQELEEWQLGIRRHAAQHQEPPQQERKPMTEEQDRALCEAYCNAASDEYFKARPQLDSDANRRIFYAGHRNAWLEWQTAHGIKE